MKAWYLVLSLFLAFQLNAFADDDAPLDPAPKAAHPVVEDIPIFGFWRFEDPRPVVAGNLAEAIGFQTPVKSQGGRGTCSIFSATATVESIAKKLWGQELDLSENYLEYLVQTRMKPAPSEGSDTPSNIPAIQRFGTIFEATWPYETVDWTKDAIAEEEKQRAQETCGSFQGTRRSGCFMTHMDPMGDKYGNEAAQFLQTYPVSRMWYRNLGTQTEIRQILSQSYPVILSIEFFYGAWNHRKMETLGIGARDMDKWGRGVVGVPNARDMYISRQNPAGHSIVIVGFDDLKRVYYFKNSWGTSGFGVQSDLLGPETSSGYGTISYDYAHRYGTFYDVYVVNEQGVIIRTPQ